MKRGLTIRSIAALSPIVLVMGTIAWTVVARTGVTLLAESRPKTALALNPSSSAALNSFAAQQISHDNGDLDAARKALQQALRTSPLDQQALFLLAELARRENDVRKADALMRVAGERSWRNLPVQISLLETELGQRQYGRALEHVDAALRISPQLAYEDNRLLGLLTAYLLDPTALRSMVQFLSNAPPWREWFLQKLCELLVNREPLDVLYASLSAGANPPTHKERLAYIVRLIKDRRYAEAQQQWALKLPGGPRALPVSYPYNREFKTEPDGSPFDWLIVTGRGAEVRLDSSAGGTSGRLTAQFSGSRVDMMVNQLQVLPPGRYVLSGEVTAQNLHANRGLRWQLLCDEPSQQQLAATDLVTKDVPWTRFSLPFEVPSHACSAQWLRLEIPARVPSEREIEGQVSYRALAIDPVDAKSGLQLLWRWPN